MKHLVLCSKLFILTNYFLVTKVKKKTPVETKKKIKLNIFGIFFFVNSHCFEKKSEKKKKNKVGLKQIISS